MENIDKDMLLFMNAVITMWWQTKTAVGPRRDWCKPPMSKDPRSVNRVANDIDFREFILMTFQALWVITSYLGVICIEYIKLYCAFQ